MNKKYEIEKLLGSGTFGSVYSLKNEPNFVVKIYKRKDNYTMRELSILNFCQDINIPNVLHCKQVFEENGKVGVLLPRFEKTLLEVEFPLSPEKINSIMKQILTGLIHLHAFGICHRDIKPENIFINSDGYVGLSDLGGKFGYSRMITLSGEKLGEHSCETGSLYYISPEILYSKLEFGKCFYNSSADIWSLGIVYIFLLTGKIPIKGKNSKDQLDKITQVFGSLEAEKEVKVTPTLPKLFNFSSEQLKIIENLCNMNPEQRVTAVEALKFFSKEEFKEIKFSYPKFDQLKISNKERSSCVNKLINLTFKLNQCSDVFFSTVTLLDCVYNSMKISRLQSLAVACFYISSQLFDINPVNIDLLAHETKSSYLEEEVKYCEQLFSYNFYRPNEFTLLMKKCIGKTKVIDFSTNLLMGIMLDSDFRYFSVDDLTDTILWLSYFYFDLETGLLKRNEKIISLLNKVKSLAIANKYLNKNKYWWF